MRKNRQNQSRNSLEMFLDTICNTFGGILFILLFVVLLLKMTRPEKMQSVNDSHSPSEQAQLSSDLESARYEWNTLLEEQKSLEESARRILNPEAVALYQKCVEKRAEVQSVTSQTESVRRDAEKLEKEVRNVQDKLEQQTAATEQARQKQAELEKGVRHQEESLEQNRTESMENQALPQLRATNKEEVAIVLQFKRLYLWHHYDSSLNRSGLNSDDFVVTGKGPMGSVYTKPKPWRGIDLTDKEHARSAIETLMKRFPEHRFMFVIVTGSDTFDEYRFVRNIAKSLDYEIRPIPLHQDMTVADRGASYSEAQ